MKQFFKNIGLLFILSGIVLLLFYTTTQNRIANIHLIIAGIFEISGLIIYILTNKHIES
ncbi:hypothetical protein JCM21142_142 [Saccharicrinis fermentans DSM 9555 = JCM 21142]|uniref:Uncharacterized protein n=1 Tax=Saccharicrinis fermentans DSM 9555 = JCM 21142 TaxID=869213 RepID=W7YG11_9BACT|nr:hypothetical protein JCM21142_142 [Saccharicrinis fermentans DSM 9555 = JCM 21142]